MVAMPVDSAPVLLFMCTTGIVHKKGCKDWCVCSDAVHVGCVLCQVGTCTLCFLNFLLCYALIPNIKQIILCSFYSIVQVSTHHKPVFITLYDSFSYTFLCSGQTAYNYTWLLTESQKRIMYSWVLSSIAVGYVITSCLNPLYQHYAGIPKLPSMPKTMPAYCACPYCQVMMTLR